MRIKAVNGRFQAKYETARAVACCGGVDLGSGTAARWFEDLG